MKDPYDYEPKDIEWRRFHVAMMVPTEFAQPVIDWLWERHGPHAGKRMVVTNASLRVTAHDTVTQVSLIMEYTARGANKTDVRRKAWEALTKVAGTTQVNGRVEAHAMAYVNIGFGHWAKNDESWLADQAHAAAAVADEIIARVIPEDDEDYSGSAA